MCRHIIIIGSQKMSEPVFDKLFKRLQALQEGTANQQSVTNQEGTANQQSGTNQEGTANQQSVTNQEPDLKLIKIQQGNLNTNTKPISNGSNQVEHNRSSSHYHTKSSYEIIQPKQQLSKTANADPQPTKTIDSHQSIPVKNIKFEPADLECIPIKQTLKSARNKLKLEENKQQMLDNATVKLRANQFTDEKFRRNFVLRILNKYADQQTNCFESTTEADKIQLLRKEAKAIGLNVLDAKNWMIAYRIAFQIEDALKGKCDHDGEEYVGLATKDIADKLKEYLANNPGEKRYSLLKVQVTVFKALGLIEHSPGIWFNENILGIFSAKESSTCNQKQYRGARVTDSYEQVTNGINRLKSSRQSGNPGINQRSNEFPRRGLTRRDSQQYKTASIQNLNRITFPNYQQELSCKYEWPENSYDSNYGIKRDRLLTKIEEKLYDSRDADSYHEQSIQSNKLQRRGRENRLSSYPINFKVKVAEKLDQLFANFIQNILSSRARQICVSKTELREIYEDFGTFSFDRKIYLSISSDKLRKTLQQQIAYDQTEIDRICCRRVTPEELKGFVKDDESDEELRPPSSYSGSQRTLHNTNRISANYSAFRN